MPDSNAFHTSLADVSVPFAPPEVLGVTDSELLDLQRELGEIARRAASASAVVAAEIAHRSRPDLGYEGLAQRLGTRTPQQLVQRLTGGTARDAAALVRVGSLIPVVDASGTPADASGPEAGHPSIPSSEPWLRSVGVAVAAGRLSVAAADAIRAGLGAPSEAITESALATATERLVAEAPALTLERLSVAARNSRAELDAAADAALLIDREREMRERRYLHLSRQADGMTRISGLLDPESAALVASAVDGATSPRRGGPRFVDPTAVDAADELVRDPRTTEQIVLDALVEFVRVGSTVAPDAVLAGRGAAVRVLVTARDLAAGHGIARIEGQSEPVSIATAERHRCASGSVAVVFDSAGQPLDLGRDRRLFSRHQRIAIAARDGGCRFPGCERPPSWTEAHHIVPWQEGGGTDVADGVLLCRHHHLLVHDNGWRVTRTGGEYAVVPPRSLDPAQRPIPAPSKSPVLERLLAQRAG